MEEAYMKASANDTLPATARQVMYAARPKIQEQTGGRQLDDKYFTQTLLPDYMEEHDVDWDVVFDDRGHFIEPHTDRTVGLGTLSVRGYLSDMAESLLTEPSFKETGLQTCGPDGCYGGILFVEKEGFLPLFAAAHIAKRFDIAIMSTKGMSVTAARMLVDDICGDHDIPLFILHDFDKSGFSIAGTFQRDTRRYSFVNNIKVVDLGLRLADIGGLLPEQAFDKGCSASKKANLRDNGATEEEIAFLLERRVELNAMASDELVTFVERKLTEHGVKKLVPDKEKLGEAYRLFERGQRIKQVVEAALKDFDSADVKVPDNLEVSVREILANEPTLRWIDAVRHSVGVIGR
jgi:hypothetical protein